MRSQESMSIEWNDRGINGYIDQFRPNEFLVDTRGVESSHLVFTPRGQLHGIAHFRKVVKGKTAVLDYAAFRAENVAASIDIGEFHLYFSDTDRTKLVSAE